MTRRTFALVVLVGALALGGASIAWAVNAARNDGWASHHYAYGPSMMGLGYSTSDASPVGSIAAARERAQAFADRLDLETGEILRFERNYYVTLEKNGAAATEALIDPATGATSLEYGPAMMWNTTYGMRSGKLGGAMMSGDAMRSMMGDYASSSGMMGGGGMMGGYASPSIPPTNARLSFDRMHEIAQQWLDANQPGMKVEPGGDAFPGYVTLETLRDGKIAGMISVNTTTGAVWWHWWHGKFVERSA